MKNNVRFIRRLDSVYLFTFISFIVFTLLNNFISKETINIIFTFFSFFIGWYLFSIFMIKDIDVKALKVQNNLTEISLEFYKKGIYISEKVGDYYIFKTRNFIIPNLSIFVKENNKHCVILAPLKDSIWIKKGLEEVKKNINRVY